MCVSKASDDSDHPTHNPAIPTEELSIEDKIVGKDGLNLTSRFNGNGRNFRSFTVLRDFQPHYEKLDFNNMEPIVFGNGLGAAGFDSVFFAHLAKNWNCTSKLTKKQTRLDVDR